MFRFQKKYFSLALILFFVEVFIALFIHDKIIRPFIGDLLVVVFLYFLLKSFLKISSLKIAIGVLLFSFSIEIAQYFGLVNILGLSDNRFARIIIGTVFHWLDLLAYLLGILWVYFIDRKYLCWWMLLRIETIALRLCVWYIPRLWSGSCYGHWLYFNSQWPSIKD